MSGDSAPGDLVDAIGTVHRPAGAEARIVSLVPSLTELLFDLGLGPAVVGRTAFCVHPTGAVRSARNVGGTKQVNLEKLAALRPTHIVVNIDETPRPLAETLQAMGYVVVVTHPVAVRDNEPLFRLFGALFDRRGAADALIARFRAAYDHLAAAAAKWPAQRVLYLIWKDPWMTVAADTYIAGMLGLAGWQTISGEGEPRYPRIELDDPILGAVDQVLFSSEPFPFMERHLRDFRAIYPVHADKGLLIDGQMVSWYGSRAILGLDYLRNYVAAVRTT